MRIRKKPQYRRLAKNLTRHSLWWASDHLLHVEKKEFSEKYERFYFQDIQAILLQRTGTGTVLTTILAIVAGLAAMLALNRESNAGLVFWGTIFAIFAGFGGFNLFLGSTCRCYLVTAVKQYRLTALSRVKKAKRVMTRIKPLVQRAQKDIQIEDIQPDTTTVPTESSQSSMYFRSQNPSASQPIAPPAVKHYHGRMHMAVFILLVVSAMSLSILLLSYNAAVVLLYWGIILGITICVIIALVKQHGTDMTTGLKGITWGALGYSGISCLLGYIFFWAAFMKYFKEMGRAVVNDNMAMYKAAMAYSPHDLPFFVSMYYVLAISALLLGSIGAWLLIKFKREL